MTRTGNDHLGAYADAYDSEDICEQCAGVNGMHFKNCVHRIEEDDEG